MRVKIILSQNTSIVPFNYQPTLTGAIQKWLGKHNQWHDTTSLYSFSWLKQGKAEKSGLNFPNGAFMFISAYEKDLLALLIQGIKQDPCINYGMKVQEIMFCNTGELIPERRFWASSPILIKRKNANGQEMHYTFNDETANKLLTETLKTKLKKAGIEEKGVEVYFDCDFERPKTKVVYYGRIGNRVNLCPVYIKGSKEQIAFAYDVGIGNSTGIGFGAIS